MSKKRMQYEVADDNLFKELRCKEPQELLTRAKLLDKVSGLIKVSDLPQNEVAVKLGITQPKVSMLISGRLSAFSTDTLLQYLSILGCQVEIRIKKPSKLSIFVRRGRIAVKGMR